MELEQQRRCGVPQYVSNDLGEPLPGATDETGTQEMSTNMQEVTVSLEVRKTLYKIRRYIIGAHLVLV